jgi:hypothetical protein
MKRSEAIKEIATALCRFQGQVETVLKDADNPFYKSKYATLGKVLEVIRKPMLENGLSFVQLPEDENELITLLMHQSGEWIETSYKLPPLKMDPQSRGSAITYQRRYAITSILGIAIDEDDDGNKASEPGKKTEVNQPTLQEAMIKMKQCQTLEDVKSCWLKYKSFQSDKTFEAQKEAMKKALTKNDIPSLDDFMKEATNITDSNQAVELSAKYQHLSGDKVFEGILRDLQTKFKI